MKIVTSDTRAPTNRERLNAWDHGTYRQRHDAEVVRAYDQLAANRAPSRDGGTSQRNATPDAA